MGFKTIELEGKENCAPYNQLTLLDDNTITTNPG